MDQVYCDYCVDTFSPVEYASVNFDGLNFCSDTCARAWERLEEDSNA